MGGSPTLGRPWVPTLGRPWVAIHPGWRVGDHKNWKSARENRFTKTQKPTTQGPARVGRLPRVEPGWVLTTLGNQGGWHPPLSQGGWSKRLGWVRGGWSKRLGWIQGGSPRVHPGWFPWSVVVTLHGCVVCYYSRARLCLLVCVGYYPARM